MLKTIDILNSMNDEDRKKYEPMLKMVHIPDFYKCIAQFSGLLVSALDEETMKEYLLIWCKNKYRFFKMLGNRTKLDIPFKYKRNQLNIKNEIRDLSKKFPAYALWLDGFDNLRFNKINSMYDIKDSLRAFIYDLFPNYRFAGSTITHFFKRYLDAPDELVTSIAALYENSKVEAMYTISIDPVDMMLASENPYDWTSCYRLELTDSSHADGCMAAMLDTSSLITYVWNNHGKFELYDTYHFDDIRYKKMRAWIAISSDMHALHFNDIYPRKNI